MNHLPSLISDLALILLCAGLMTLLFNRLKQPLVLGYIVAGFLASPHLSVTPTVVDVENIRIWGDIGVIFLLFSLGMEFSVKKMMREGSSSIVSALLVMTFMSALGIAVAGCFGWPMMDCLYLGGMLAMSSTTIIYKAFADMGLRQQRFAQIVIGVLVIEDILAVVLMVLLSTTAVSRGFEGSQLVMGLLKLGFYLILWFVVGIFLIPQILKRCRSWFNNETMLIFALALCFGMVVLASKVGFSPAFGAFIMGSILAETAESEQIERLISPLKDLFGAVFFVSVGMMVDINMIVEYWKPILIITLAIIGGQSILGSVSFLVAGNPLKRAIRCGFSLTQIGEFSFIIATMGMMLGVISDFLYPIVVAVSVITTFISPYMIRASVPASHWVERHLPDSILKIIYNYTSGYNVSNTSGRKHWKEFFSFFLRDVLIASVMCTAIIIISTKFLKPFIYNWLPEWGADLLTVSITLSVLSPFLFSLVLNWRNREKMVSLIKSERFYRLSLMLVFIFRFLLSLLFIWLAIVTCYHYTTAVVVTFVSVALLMLTLNRSKNLYRMLERTFLLNLNYRDLHSRHVGKKDPRYVKQLKTYDLHMSEFQIPMESAWGGHSLSELGLGKKYGIHLVSILRGNYRINAPGGELQLFPGDRIQVIGNDEVIKTFGEAMMLELLHLDENNMLEREMIIRTLIIRNESPFIGKTIANSEIRDKYKCLVIGWERGEAGYGASDISIPFCEGDILFLVGETKMLARMFSSIEA